MITYPNSSHHPNAAQKDTGSDTDHDANSAFAEVHRRSGDGPPAQLAFFLAAFFVVDFFAVFLAGFFSLLSP